MRWAVWLGVLEACSTPELRKDAPTDRDISYRERQSLTLTEEDGSYRLSSIEEVAITYRSRRSTQSATRVVYAPFYAPVDQLRAELDGERLPSDRIVEVTPEGRHFLTDGKLFLLKFKQAEVGQTASWRYRKRYRSPEWLPLIRVPNMDRVEQFEIEIQHPPAVELKLELFFPRRRLNPLVTRAPTLTRVVFNNLPHLMPLDAFPYNKTLAIVWPKLRRHGRPVNPVTPEEVRRWHRGLFKQIRPFDSSQQAQIDRLLAGAASPREKVKRVYDWVRGKVRYIADERGVHGLVPRDPSRVMKLRYGDCKDMAYLVVEMARRAGVRVEPVLVATHPVAELDGVHPMLFDHTIASYREDGRRLYMDPTCYPCELGNLPEADIEKRGLVLGERAEEVLIPAPEQGPGVELEIQASADDLTHGRVRVLLRNDELWSALEIRRKPMSRARRQTSLSKLINSNLYRIELEDLDFESVAEDHAVLRGRVNLESFVVRSQRRLYLPKVPFRTRDGKLLERRNDPHDIHLSGRDHMRLTVDLLAPGCRVGTAHPLRLGASEVAEFSAELGEAKEAFRARYAFRQHQKRFPRGRPEREALLDFQQRYLEARRQMFALECTAPATQKSEP